MTRAGAGALLCALALSAAGCGSSDSGAKPTKTSVDPFSVVPAQPTDSAAAGRRAAPRFERVAVLTGSGPATRSVTIARSAIQWRARWRCERGAMRLSAAPASGRATVARRTCGRTGQSSGVRSGALGLRVETPGSWRVVVEQQVDTALHEPPLASMRAPGARVLARGRFYDVERFGRGSAVLHRLPGGRLALRLQGFATSANTDLFVWISSARRPRTTVQAQRSRHRVLASLKSTLGEQNYVLPAGATAADVRSIVIWCEPVQIAYTAATLRR
jgi:hypothetical protein